MEDQPPESPTPTLEPAPGPVAADPVIPWEADDSPWASRLVATIQLLFTRPREAFASVPLDGDLLKPFVFALVVGSIGFSLNLLWEGLVRGAMHDLMARTGGTPRFELPLVAIPFMALFSPALVALAVVCTAAIDHLFLLIVGGAKRGFGATTRAVCYGFAAQLLLALPFCGGFFAGIAGLVFSIVGFSAVHRISVAQAALAVLLPVLLCCACIALALVTYGTAFLGSFGSGALMK
ncbi:MAG: YIP1 family protein [Candidatus Eisenbacteria bacterium]